MSDDLTTFARRYRQEAAAALLAVVRDDTAIASARTNAAVKILEYADGRPGQARPVTVATLKDLTPDERFQIFQALIKYYAADIGLDQMITQVVDEVERRAAKPQIQFRRGTPVPAIPSTPAVAGNGAPGAATHHNGAESIPSSEQYQNAPCASGRQASVDPPSLRNEADDPLNLLAPRGLDASHDRSTRLAELAAGYLPKPRPVPVLAADSSDGYQTALALSRLSADQLQSRYYGRFNGGDNDPTIWRGRGKR